MAATSHQPVPLSELTPITRHCSGTATVDVSPGWAQIVLRLDRELSSLDPGYRLSRLEAHDGHLKVDWYPGDEPGWPERPRSEDPDELAAYEEAVQGYLSSMVHHRRVQWEDRLREIGNALVLAARRESAHTCEECGRRTERHVGDAVVCAKCQHLPLPD